MARIWRARVVATASRKFRSGLPLHPSRQPQSSTHRLHPAGQKCRRSSSLTRLSGPMLPSHFSSLSAVLLSQRPPEATPHSCHHFRLAPVAAVPPARLPLLRLQLLHCRNPDRALRLHHIRYRSHFPQLPAHPPQRPNRDLSSSSSSGLPAWHFFGSFGVLNRTSRFRALPRVDPRPLPLYHTLSLRRRL